MRVLLLSAEYPPQVGGVGDYTRHLAQALAGRSHEVAVLTGTVDDPALSLSASSAAFSVLRRVRHWGWELIGTVRQTLAEFKPDVLHIQYQSGAYAMQPAVNLLPLRLGARRPALAVTCHDLYMPYLFPKAGPLRRWVTRKMLEHADVVVVTNETDRLRLEGQGAPDPRLYLADRPLRRPVTLIPIGSNIAFAVPPHYRRSEVRAALGIDERALLVAYFGLLSYSKGLDLLLEALAALPEHFHLLVVGGEANSPEDKRFAAEIVEQIARLDLLGRVQMTGQLSEEEVTRHLLAADLAALPFRDGASYRRGSLLAMLAHGVPSITTAPASALSPPLDGAALLVAVDDVAALRDALATLAANQNLRYALSDRGIALAAAFDWSSIAQQHEELYRQLLARSSAVAYQ